MMNKYSKWIPLTVYSDAIMTRYLLLAKRNNKTGMICFKSKKINKITSHDIFYAGLKMEEQFNKLIKEAEL